ncbi:MAG: DUF4886 domain-containing protein [Candidatus Omnitrophica bacterium]|nr:DUF4886 domain-containing protein [Candidatus Omnitrophota bacterium]MBU1996479.1 DUF4886 domain-containing protein [Candidatus Omnitrophota bacterium]MBU4334040.1 DUF4886 domain-containing protein [Candidatus Omnitrophota bacterium]
MSFNKKIFQISLLSFGLLFVANGQNMAFGEKTIKILFVGNSYVYMNDLPRIFTDIARYKGYAVETAMVTGPGWSLAKHANSLETLSKINSKRWDYVILQEQSMIPVMKDQCGNRMLPAARKLISAINNKGATPILFMTWGRRNGLKENGFKDFNSMQNELSVCYLRVAKTLKAAVAPVGDAWQNAKRGAPLLDFWNSDNSHPNLMGSYLAACVIYAAIFQESPEGIGDHLNLGKTKAEYLQKTAAETVLKDLKRWYIK